MAEVILERAAGVATVTLAAPERRNALTRSMARELVEACEEIDADAAIGAVVVRGEGGFFCAGGDRGTLANAGRDPATVGRTATVLVDCVRTDDLALRLERPASTPEPIVGDTAEIAATIRAFADEGISHIQIMLQPNSLEGIERFAPVLEALKA